MLLYQTLDLFLPDAQEEIRVFAESFCGCDDCFENAGLGPCGFVEILHFESPRLELSVQEPPPFEGKHSFRSVNGGGAGVQQLLFGIIRKKLDAVERDGEADKRAADSSHQELIEEAPVKIVSPPHLSVMIASMTRVDKGSGVARISDPHPVR
ncbi:hypothetical protein DY000_02017253 [Brassica cretica]|uniref:Uncharacterized protein n=1 Tax=Brassica cretica TaxID=69181 RepID=A0ABQ7DAH2_BRACR|nr:hypothetical protein DY000_02017253 [Brassica cretica]